MKNVVYGVVSVKPDLLDYYIDLVLVPLTGYKTELVKMTIDPSNRTYSYWVSRLGGLCLTKDTLKHGFLSKYTELEGVIFDYSKTPEDSNFVTTYTVQLPPEKYIDVYCASQGRLGFRKLFGTLTLFNKNTKSLLVDGYRYGFPGNMTVPGSFNPLSDKAVLAVSEQNIIHAIYVY